MGSCWNEFKNTHGLEDYISWRFRSRSAKPKLCRNPLGGCKVLRLQSECSLLCTRRPTHTYMDQYINERHSVLLTSLPHCHASTAQLPPSHTNHVLYLPLEGHFTFSSSKPELGQPKLGVWGSVARAAHSIGPCIGALVRSMSKDKDPISLWVSTSINKLHIAQILCIRNVFFLLRRLYDSLKT